MNIYYHTVSVDQGFRSSLTVWSWIRVSHRL